jgi:predicted HAD superfamily Cof-like phosphohydrolase
MIFELVEQFNKEVIGIRRPRVQRLHPKEEKWLGKALAEEVEEFKDATSIVAQVDALIDLIYFAAGGLTRLGFPAEASMVMFQAVHKANMAKKKGIKETRGHELDAVKPEDWVAPEGSIADIIRQNS